MTDEQLVAYLDAAQDRLTASGTGRFTEDVETVRAGTIFAHDQKAYTRWRSDVNRRSGRTQRDGKTLAQLAHDFGGQVTRGDFEFKH